MQVWILFITTAAQDMQLVKTDKCIKNIMVGLFNFWSETAMPWIIVRALAEVWVLIFCLSSVMQ